MGKVDQTRARESSWNAKVKARKGLKFTVVARVSFVSRVKRYSGGFICAPFPSIFAQKEEGGRAHSIVSR